MTKIVTIFSFLIFVGCTTENNRPIPVEDLSESIPATKRLAPKVQNKSHKQQTAPKEQAITLNLESIKRKLQKHYAEWKGVKYKYSGMSKKGIDCSGFIYLTYRNIFNKKLPRSTKLLASAGKFINKSQLQPGDLILYNTSATVRHVGIYMGGNKFLHASKSKGVMISDINLDYWRSRYWQSRRVL